MEKEILNEFENYWKVNPVGNKEEALFYFRSAIKNKKLNGYPIKPKQLVELYKDYYESLIQYQAGKYTKKEYRIVDPADFIMDGIFLNPIRKTIDPLDFYLYGIK